MATSGVYTYSVSRDKIIRLALLTIRKLDELETPTPQETTDCADFLNMLCKQWQGQADFAPGLKTWHRRRASLFLSSTTNKYTVGPGGTGWTESYTGTTLTAAAASGQAVIAVKSATGISVNDNIGVQLDSGALQWTTVSSIASLNITLAANLSGKASANNNVFDYTTTAQQPVVVEAAILRDINNLDTPLTIIRDTATYDALPSKNDTTNKGDPTAIYPEFLLTNSNFYTDIGAANDVTKHIVITYLEAAQDFVNATDTPEYPQEWYLALALGLAKLIAPMYGATWSQANEANYTTALAIAQRKEPEVSMLYFQCNAPL